VARKKKKAEPEQAVVAPAPVPRSRFLPSDCSLCKRLRLDKGDMASYARVYATAGRIRYCKCGFCNNTWKELGE